MGYKVKLNVFEGPFDLLVYLIENARMSIYDIQIAEITEQYLAYMEELKELDVPVAGEFMVLAASLIEIKSKMLLPQAPSEDAGDPEEDPRARLVEKLIEYKRFKRAADMLSEKEDRGMRILEKAKEDLSVYTGETEEYLELDLDKFVKAFYLFLQRKKKVEEIRRHHLRTERQRITAEARMRDIADFFRQDREKEANFKELVPRGEDPYDVALTFSAVLEMMKENRICASQNCLYGDIMVTAAEGLDEGEKND